MLSPHKINSFNLQNHYIVLVHFCAFYDIAEYFIVTKYTLTQKVPTSFELYIALTHLSDVIMSTMAS